MDFFEVLAWFGRHSAWLLLPAAVIVLLWALEAKKRPDMKDQEWQRSVNVSTMVKVFSWVGMVYGFFLMVGAVMAELGGYAPSLAYNQINNTVPGSLGPVNHFTVIVYFVTGAIMFFKPLKDIPLASLISLGVTVGVTVLCVAIIPGSTFGNVVTAMGIDLKWIYIIIFLILLAVTYALMKISVGFLMRFSKIVSMPPFAVIYGSFILVQAIIVLFGYSIVMW
ncbi:MAG: hypothetical protein GYA24_02885 [Candidatus Lokiarchaeota archaeon]|nr:hypothetical protein [Candidatus Lokiarchaeota archaeon]